MGSRGTNRCTQPLAIDPEHPPSVHLVHNKGQQHLILPMTTEYRRSYWATATKTFVRPQLAEGHRHTSSAVRSADEGLDAPLQQRDVCMANTQQKGRKQDFMLQSRVYIILCPPFGGPLHQRGCRNYQPHSHIGLLTPSIGA